MKQEPVIIMLIFYKYNSQNNEGQIIIPIGFRVGVYECKKASEKISDAF